MFRILPRIVPAARSFSTVPRRPPNTKFDPERHFPGAHWREVNHVRRGMEKALLGCPEGKKWAIMDSAISRITELAKREVRRLQEEEENK